MSPLPTEGRTLTARVCGQCVRSLPRRSQRVRSPGDRPFQASRPLLLWQEGRGRAERAASPQGKFGALCGFEALKPETPEAARGLPVTPTAPVSAEGPAVRQARLRCSHKPPTSLLRCPLSCGRETGHQSHRGPQADGTAPTSNVPVTVQGEAGRIHALLNRPSYTTYMGGEGE